MKIEAGKVMRVQTVSGVRLAILKARYGWHPRTGEAGDWYRVISNDLNCLAGETSILDQDPTCEFCGSRKWWWTASFQIRCARCVPPLPDWPSMWRDFSELIERLSSKLGVNEHVRSLVVLADKAFADDDWCEFLRIYTVAGSMTQFERQIGGPDEERQL